MSNVAYRKLCISHEQIFKQQIPQNLSVNQTHEKLQYLLQQWAFPSALISELTGEVIGTGNIFVEIYARLLRQFDSYFDFCNIKHDKDMLFSGFSLFYGCVIQLVGRPNWNLALPDMFYYVLLYFLVDHYLDDENKTEDKAYQKYKIKKIRQILQGNSILDDSIKQDSTLYALFKIYGRMLERKPLVKNAILQLYDAEVDSVTIQHNANLTFAEYTNLVYQKGGWTTGVTAAFANYAADSIQCDYFRQVGVIVQFFDDLLDYESDNSKNYYNTVRYCYENGKLYKLVSYIIQLIEQLHGTNNIFRILSLHMLAYSIMSCPIFKDCHALKQIVQNFNLFPLQNELNDVLTPYIERHLLDSRLDTLNIQGLLQKTFLTL